MDNLLARLLRGDFNRDRFIKVPIDNHLAERYETLMNGGDSDSGDEFRREFFKAFFAGLTSEGKTNLLTRVAPLFRSVPEALTKEPIPHPVLGRDKIGAEDRGLHRAEEEILHWLVDHAAWGTDSVAFEYAVPPWFMCALLNFCLSFYDYEPDRCEGTRWAKAFLLEKGEEGQENAFWSAAPKYSGERVKIMLAETWERRDAESRDEFLQRILGDLATHVLNQLTPQAEAMDDFVESIGLPYPTDTKAGRKRARQCARRLLGLPVPTTGADQREQDKHLETLGFTAP